MAVERIADFRPQGVSGSEATGADAYGGPGGEGCLPEGLQQGVRSHHFESVLTGVAGTGDPDSLTVPIPPPDLVFGQRRGRHTGDTAERMAGEQGVDEFWNTGPLNGDGTRGSRDVVHAHFGAIRKGIPTGL